MSNQKNDKEKDAAASDTKRIVMLRKIVFKVRILFMLLADTYNNWKSEIWKKDLNEYVCCDGDRCGCDGVTITELYESFLEE